ncbi:HAD family hydrolase [Paenibacillus crassostreae]|uniref:Haloacid dehalogenase n=1 Tax=Paenibacillus crassostreae TaxID=1763538 RepID=A0A167FTL0_9BACL|nr:hypothetical protein [Paenibacillus crassostreae]AOZ94077.1 hypothetical protein LPB68_19060 [Paenibacillus crassostreae]OAB76887.1 hypothetical protein PNBC_05680 [Paenibacillus crassostreae]
MTVTNKFQLVLDVGGVLISNLSPTWEGISSVSSLSPKELKKYFNEEIRHDFWTGNIPEEYFWSWVIKHCPTLDIKNARSLLQKNLMPLAAFDCIANWSELADIHLLSNHREEWLDPLIQPLKPYLKSFTISSSVGCCKPNSEIYSIVHSHFTNQHEIWFVDDQEKNFAPAKTLGWNTLIADQNGEWIGQIEKLLNK